MQFAGTTYFVAEFSTHCNVCMTLCVCLIFSCAAALNNSPLLFPEIPDVRFVYLYLYL